MRCERTGSGPHHSAKAHSCNAYPSLRVRQGAPQRGRGCGMTLFEQFAERTSNVGSSRCGSDDGALEDLERAIGRHEDVWATARLCGVAAAE